ncbi:MAG TPA: metalloregulator ArsR/SmtB family transcription factor [Blastocatellia bacterium]|nr:metalloregulator ArsR/SmtB family transcription factor [Blastocatellia bacterium]
MAGNRTGNDSPAQGGAGESQSGGRKTRRAIVKLLKTEGPMDSSRLAKRLGLTSMAVRQHLYSLEQEKMVTAEDRPVPIGRPAKYWQLTREADRLFPDAHAELSVALIDALGDAFGPEGLDRVLQSRAARQRADYSTRVDHSGSLKEKLRQLAQVRTEEGYMAELKAEGKGRFLLVENHCPICAAATACLGFCSTELDLFRAVLGPGVKVERAEHLISGDRRCAYLIEPAAHSKL